jgi:tripartite-type tricarboxylate transporter receptor subunit TctC
MPSNSKSFDIDRRRLLATSVLMALAGRSWGQAPDGYPSRSVNVVVPFTPGGTTDVVGRLLSQPLGEDTGKAFVVDNRTGAAGVIAWNYMAKAAPDGYTLLVHDLSLAITAGLKKNLAFDAKKAFVPIITAATVPHVLVVNPDLPVKNVQELIALAKSKPGKLFFGSGGVGTNPHMGGELFKATAGVDLTHIPYKGGAGSLPDLISGQIQVQVSSVPTVLPQIQAGKIKPLMVTSRTRMAVLPDVPSAVEVGLPGMEMLFWAGLAAPAGTPKPVIDWLHGELKKVLATPQAKEKFAQMGLEIRADSQAEAQKLLADEIDRWAKLGETAHISVE